VPNELKNAELLTCMSVRPTMKSIIHRAKHIDLHSVVGYYVQFQHFEWSLMFIAQTM